jgi:hypothetical protein
LLHEGMGGLVVGERRGASQHQLSRRVEAEEVAGRLDRVAERPMLPEREEDQKRRLQASENQTPRNNPVAVEPRRLAQAVDDVGGSVHGSVRDVSRDCSAAMTNGEALHKSLVPFGA